MRFVRGLWKLLVGIKDGLALVFLLLFFAALYALLSIRPLPAVTDGILTLRLTGSLVEQPSEPDPLGLVTGAADRIREHRLRDLVTALDAAAGDGRVKGVALDLDGFLGGGQAAVGDLADALGRVRSAGKPVLAYATAYSDNGYQLAAHASEVWLNPLGVVAITGPGGQSLYFKGLLDRLGVAVNVYRVGTYKAAVEPFIRNDMSPEARQDAQALAGALFESWREDVAAARPKAALDAYVRDTPAMVAAAGGDLAAAAVRARLVDRVGDRRLFERRLAAIGGADEQQRGGYRRVRLDSYVAESDPSEALGPVGVVTVAGTIIDGEAGPGTAGGDTIAKAIEDGLKAGGLKALVVRIDSPGGSVTASERIRQAVLAAKERRLPVVMSMGSVAASGGYWVATAGNRVLAEPATITGSIGVFGLLPSFKGSREKIGLGADGVKTTPLSGEPDLLNGPSPQASQLIQAGVESTYRRFVALVAHSRKLSPQQVDAIAQGRVWDGGTARQLGLVDQFGDLSAAIAEARRLAKLDDDAAVRYLDPGRGLQEELLDWLGDEEESAGDSADALAPSPARLLAVALGTARQILGGPAIQVRCLQCPAVSPPPLPDLAGRPLGEMLLLWLLR